MRASRDIGCRQRRFLRSETSLIQTIGRAARNVEGRVILYADRMTGSMERAIRETDRRREKQHAYNIEHGITPATIKRDIHDIVADTASRDSVLVEIDADGANNLVGHNLRAYIDELEKKMRDLDTLNRRFEVLRDSSQPLI